MQITPRTVAASVAVVCVAGLSACSAGHTGQPSSHYLEDTYPVSPGHDKRMVAIGQGNLGGHGWTLRAGQNAEGQLCLVIACTEPGGDPGSDGCGFGSNQVDDEGRGTEPIDIAESRARTPLAFGPSPVGAVRAVLTEPTVGGTDCRAAGLPPATVPIEHQLPSWYPVHGRGWFTAVISDAAQECGLLDVRFLDSRGRTVPQPNDY